MDMAAQGINKMTFNFNNKFGKYICIHCKVNFIEIPKEKLNECIPAVRHFIVEKKRLQKIEVRR